VLGERAHEVEVRTGPSAGERPRELGQRGLRELAGLVSRPLDAAGTGEQVVHVEHLALEALRPLAFEEARQATAVVAAEPLEGVRRDQGPLPLPEVTTDLLAVRVGPAHEVEDVVVDLERRLT
jgi:hypothetical protein